jgi:hypothetical protein
MLRVSNGVKSGVCSWVLACVVLTFTGTRVRCVVLAFTGTRVVCRLCRLSMTIDVRVARLDQWDLGLLVPPFSTLVTVMLIMYAFGFTLVVIWTGHSVHKHGWRRRSLRRFSYGLFTLLLAVRLAWCTFLLLRIREHPELARSTDATAVLRSLTVIVLTRAAFCLHFLAFSMLVCGWVDSTYMMMAKPSVQPTAMRAHSALFYHIGPPFIAVNTINAVLSFGTLVPLLLWQRDDGSSALESDEPLPETVSLAQWLFALSGGGECLPLHTAPAACPHCRLCASAGVRPSAVHQLSAAHPPHTGACPQAFRRSLLSRPPLPASPSQARSAASPTWSPRSDRMRGRRSSRSRSRRPSSRSARSAARTSCCARLSRSTGPRSALSLLSRSG